MGVQGSYFGSAVMPSEEGVLPPVFGGWSLGVYAELEGESPFIELLIDFEGKWMVSGTAVYPRTFSCY